MDTIRVSKFIGSVFSLFAFVLFAAQIGCGEPCADPIAMEGTDTTSGVKFVVEGTNGHQTVSNYCSFDTFKIEVIAPSGLTYKFNGQNVTLSSSESAKIMALFPQFSNVQLNNPIITINVAIRDSFAGVSVIVTEGGAGPIVESVKVELS